MFVREGGHWVQQQELEPSDGTTGDSFGNSVALNALGNEAVIGAPGHNGGQGAAYVFVHQGGQWAQQQELQATDGASGDLFGYSVAMDALGDEAVIGSPEHNGYDGASYVFVHRGGQWAQQAELQASDGGFGDEFGISVAVNALGDETIAGAIGHNGVVGAAYVFVRQGGQWTQQAELQPADGTPGDGYGISVALDALGNEGLVGAYAQNGGQGVAYLYERGDGQWALQRELAAPDGAPDDVFGYSVTLNALGDEALVGAPRHNAIKGAGYVFNDLYGGH